MIWTTQKRKISDLIPAKYNPRKLTDKQAEDLSKSLTKFNLADPIIINKNNVIIGGHQRIVILKKQGITEVDCRVPERLLSEIEEKELNLRLNKNLGEWDFELLSQFDENMLSDVGFDSVDIDKVFKDIDKPDDDLPAVKKSTNIKLEDMFQLGNHVLICGDSTKEQTVAKLMGTIKADMVFTDPPYNVDYKGMQNLKQWDSIANDAMPPDVFKEFLVKVFQNYYKFTSENAAIYICHADKSHKEFRDAFEQVGYEWRATIIWIKNSPAFNFAQYKYKHEPIFYCYKKDQTVSWFGDRTQNTCWEAKKEKGDHPTIKPVELITKAIVNSSKREDIVLDLFGGSGSTLIACEKLNRKCRTMEIDPIYCQVIIDRWEQFTGKKSIKL